MSGPISITVGTFIYNQLIFYSTVILSSISPGLLKHERITFFGVEKNQDPLVIIPNGCTSDFWWGN